MSLRSLTQPSDSNWNVPNGLSFIRLILAVAVGILIEFQFYFPALVCFVLAASTDFIDGWWARRFKQITKLGRILDPFVDKTIIGAAMIALVGVPGSGFAAWIVTLVISRELLVTSLRGMIEGAGGDFSAKQLGKWKMVAQCAAIIASLLNLLQPEPVIWLQWALILSLILAVVLTLLSGWEYLVLAMRNLSQRAENLPDASETASAKSLQST
jgi:CDP-diacylglycerol---glycerol-3-phosphate 3-phosphatidyltransferase